jgi:site-specific DNA-methyltransferase (adenine-specific)
MRIQPRNTILEGDARKQLASLPDAFVDCVVTSPPYYLQRTYGVDGQIGLEPTVEEWVSKLIGVFHEVARVLKPTGALWLNIADTYSRGSASGAPPKSLLLGPERLALALLADGWVLRNRCVWWKQAPMPSGVADRLETTYDTVYFMTRSPRYFFDLDAVREPIADGHGPALGRNPGDVWQLEKAKFGGGHFATFPERLVELPLLATCPAKVCRACGAPWTTWTTKEYIGKPARFQRDPFVRRHPIRYRVIRRHPRLAPGCSCQAPTRSGLVLDPCIGTGTVAAVAERHGRDWLGIELNPSYCDLAWNRIRGLPVRRVA